MVTGFEDQKQTAPERGPLTPAALLYSDTERDLAAALADLLARRAPAAATIARCEQPETCDLALWRTVAAEIGIAGLLIPEALGGAGASWTELAAAAEQFGAAVAPIPYLGSAAAATATLLSAARSAASASASASASAGAGRARSVLADTPVDTSQPLSGPAAAVRDARLRAQAAPGARAGTAPGARAGTAPETGPVSPAAGLLRQLATGALTAALAVPVTTGPSSPFPATVRVALSDPSGQVRLRGLVPAVADALPADVLLVPADGVPVALYLVDGSATGVHRRPLVSLDMTRQLCDISLDDAPARLVTAGPAAQAALTAGLSAGAVILAAEQLGLAQRCLDMTVSYVKERRQFARPVGSFQAVKHRLADLWTTITLARAASRYAAACLARGDDDTPVAVALAKSACCDAAVTAAEECVQLHGGIGFTWEHPAHLYLKRARAASVAFGSPGEHRAALAALADLPPPGA
jgi:alkylation response protein AidB-like acyl-CoA dehydrogenase